VPHPLPGMVIALAWVWVFLKLDFLPIYGTIWSICIAFLVSFIAYGTRMMNAAILQIHRELEEAAYTSGARYQSFGRAGPVLYSARSERLREDLHAALRGWPS
jgi:ABC-type Fe3+ transport system permease subunit